MKILCIFKINLLQAIFPSLESSKHFYSNFLKYQTFPDVISLNKQLVIRSRINT
jgi:hypothetical protein